MHTNEPSSFNFTPNRPSDAATVIASAVVIRVLSIGLLLAAPLAHAADNAVFVNVASDGAKGQHDLEALRAAVIAADKNLAGRIKSVVVLEEPTAHVPPSRLKILAEVNRLLLSAKSSYSQSNLDEASELIAEAEALALSTEPNSETLSIFAELERLNGLIALKRKDSAAADESFRVAFLLKPELAMVDAATRVYARMLRSKNRGTGRVVLKVEPINAFLYIDGKRAQLGASDPLEVGTHFVAATKDGYIGQIQRITIRKDKVVPVNLTLTEDNREGDLVAARNALISAQSDEALMLGGRRIAELTKTRWVVLVRKDEAAVIDASNRQLGPFLKMNDAVALLVPQLRGVPVSPPPVSPKPSPLEPAPTPATSAPEAHWPTPEATVPAAAPQVWYKRPWVIAAGATAVAAIVGGITAGVVLANQREPMYTVSKWCHASDCPPLN